MRAWGFENVRKEPVQVPVWVRNEESLEIIAPAHHDLALLGLGRSVGTGPDGMTADVVRVTSFEDLAARPDAAIAGKIVLFDVPFDGYGKTVRYRGSGPSAAARRGAVAALVRSVGPDGMRTPHTGALRYADDAPQIPAAAISFEDANQIARMLQRGDDVTVRLIMGSETLEDGTSYNVVGEIPGTDLADEIVVVGGHIDSWDVGQGAQDDGAGCLLSMEAVRLIADLGLQPRRTLRVVLWTNEENGLRGGEAYASQHGDEIDRHFAAMESDTGNGLADGFRFDLRSGALGDGATEADLEAARARGKAILEEVSGWLEPLGSDRVHLSYGGADIGPLAEAGVPALGESTIPKRIRSTGSFSKIFRTTRPRWQSCSSLWPKWTPPSVPEQPGRALHRSSEVGKIGTTSRAGLPAAHAPYPASSGSTEPASVDPATPVPRPGRTRLHDDLSRPPRGHVAHARARGHSCPECAGSTVEECSHRDGPACDLSLFREPDPTRRTRPRSRPRRRGFVQHLRR
jgi:carboxypeptidase Q